MVVYCGDEINAVVIDIGSSTVRAGFSGEDSPKSVFPSHYSSPPSFGDISLTQWKENKEIKPVKKEGVVDWEGIEGLLQQTYKTLRINSNEYALMMTESAWAAREEREKLTELIFEKFGVSGFYLAKEPVLSSFSAGRSTALIVDSGSSYTKVCPVYDGYLLSKSVVYQNLAGDFLSEKVMEMLEGGNVKVKPHYVVKSKQSVNENVKANATLLNRPNTTESYHKFMQMECVCQVAEVPYDEEQLSIIPRKSFEFPDGYNTSFGPERFRIPELLFNPKEWLNPMQKPLASIQQLVMNSVNHCDIDIRAQLLNNIVVVGGNTMFPGFADRLNYELMNVALGHRIKIHAAGNTIERKFSGWLGGSILSSLGTFHTQWISKSEYDEHGKGLIEKRCP